jgi:NAD(P)-dependent dehydrogenase (short-subunit alcohol dehydrogenase family)
MIRILAILLAIGAVANCVADPKAQADSKPKAVLVTGASTGIGRKITERLAADGYFVYAGARKEEDLKVLGALKNVRAVKLDVTSTADIAAVVETITQAGRGLYGLVNNAGIATAGTLAATPIEEFDLLMAVNVSGPYRMSKALLPLIVAAKGRITNIGSISGILANANLGPYSMSKHAIEAFTDSLARQMADSGVVVNVVEPGNFNSNIGKSAVQRIGAESKSTDPSLYKLAADRSIYKDADEVAVAVEMALFEPSPKHRYMVTPNQEEAEVTIRKQIQQLVQLNEGQPYTYDREALIKMLDEVMAGARPRVMPQAALPVAPSAAR